MNVLLADDQKLVCDALSTLLNLDPHINVVACAYNGADVLEYLATHDTPDIVLLDIEMPVMDGLTTCKEIKARYPQLIVGILTTFDKPGYVRRAFELGASGFMLKDTPAAQFAQQLHQLVQGMRVVDPQLAIESLTSGINPLTPRELEVLQESAKGGSIDDIAYALCLSAGTVRNHISAILAKTGARNRGDAVRIAQENGWITG